MVRVKSKALEEVVVRFLVLILFGEALTKRLIIPRERVCWFWEEDGSSNPINLRVPFPKPGHAKDELGFSEVEYHETDSLRMGGVGVIGEGEIDVRFQSNVPFTVGSPIDVKGFDWSGQGEGFEV